MASKTIKILLKDSEVNGIRIAQLSVSTVEVYVIPRDKYDFTKTKTELQSPALYMLFDDQRTSVYIGECENFTNRIKHHVENKDFWQWAVVCVAKGDGLDKAKVKFMESYAVQKAIEIGRFEILNKTEPTENTLDEFTREEVLDFFSDFDLLINTLGFNIFEEIKDDIPLADNVEKDNKAIHDDERIFDTIIAPCKGEGRINAFVKESSWYAVRIGKKNISKLKYVGLYEAAPVSAIRYYAKITKIELYKNVPGKYIIHHDGNIQELKKPIVIGSHPELALFGPRYYKLTDIESSSSMAELTDKAFGSNYSQ